MYPIVLSVIKRQCVSSSTTVVKQEIELPDMIVYHILSLGLLTRLQTGDEHLAHDLVSTVTFNADFLR